MAEHPAASAPGRTDPNRHLPPHVRNKHCVDGICTFIDPPNLLFTDQSESCGEAPGTY